MPAVAHRNPREIRDDRLWHGKYLGLASVIEYPVAEMIHHINSKCGLIGKSPVSDTGHHVSSNLATSTMYVNSRITDWTNVASISTSGEGLVTRSHTFHYVTIKAHSSIGLGKPPLTRQRRVRFPYGLSQVAGC